MHILKSQLLYSPQSLSVFLQNFQASVMPSSLFTTGEPLTYTGSQNPISEVVILAEMIGS